MAPPLRPGVRLGTLFQNAREPVFVLNAERRLVFVNRAWEELTGRAAADVLGLSDSPQDSVQADDPESLASSLRPPPEALAGQPAGRPTVILHPSGQRHWRRVEFWPFHDEQGGLLGLLGLIRDPDAPPHVPDSEAQRLQSQLLALRRRLLDRYGFDSLIGQGPAHSRLLEQVAAAAATTATVLIVGEPGTGKRHVARTIHQQSPRRRAPLIPIDCAVLPPEVIEQELFGAGEGPLSSALRLPEGSTLLLSHLLELPRDLQGRLAAALDGRVRLLATTSGDLEQARAQDRLRPDFYYAVTTLVIRLAPLRERGDDVLLLAQHFLERANRRAGRPRLGFQPEAIAALRAYDWPGNLRELARVIDTAHDRGHEQFIGVDDLPAAICGHLGAAYPPPPAPPPVTPLDALLNQLERRLIEQALRRARQNKSRAAELLNISRPRLYRRLKELNIPDLPEPANEPGANAGRPAPGADGPSA
jgi:PAS domain S-box-containing protein